MDSNQSTSPFKIVKLCCSGKDAVKRERLPICKNFIGQKCGVHRIISELVDRNKEQKEVVNMKEAHIIWISEKKLNRLMSFLYDLKIDGFVARFPYMTYICSKQVLATQNQFYSKYFPFDLRISPITFNLKYPDQREMFEDFMDINKINMILKPTYGHSGYGIRLARESGDMYKLEDKMVYVGQEYIDNPYLLENYKFDFRVYVLVTNLDPIEAYIFHEGLVRFCAKPYLNVFFKDFDYMRHITNLAVNDTSRFYKSEYDYPEKEANLRRINIVLKQLKKSGKHMYDSFWNKAKIVCEKALIILWPIYYEKIKRRFDLKNKRCFQIFGLDLLPDDRGNLWLTELNANVSLRIGPVHSKVTIPLLNSVYKILGKMNKGGKFIEYTKLNPKRSIPKLCLFYCDEVKKLYEEFSDKKTRLELWNYLKIQKENVICFDQELNFDTFCKDLLYIAHYEHPDLSTVDSMRELMTKIYGKDPYDF